MITTMVYVFVVDPDTNQKKQQQSLIQTLNLRHVCTTFYMTCPMLIIDWAI